MNEKLTELTDEELAHVTGGVGRIALRGKCDIDLLGAELSCFGLSDEPSVTPEFYLK